MASRGPGALEIRLDAGEREQLESWARRRRTAAGLASRSRIVLAAAEGESNSAIARRLGVGRPTAAKWRARFAAERLAGLLDEPRPGRPRRIDDAQVEELIVRTLETAPPDGGTHWSTRQMAAAVGLSQAEAVVAKTNSRSHLGTLNDFSYLLRGHMRPLCSRLAVTSQTKTRASKAPRTRPPRRFREPTSGM